MIKILVETGRYVPVFICDACGEQIHEPGGAIEMSRDGALREGETTDCFHVHKGACDRFVQERLGSQQFARDELCHHIARLLDSIHVSSADIDRARERMASLGGIGNAASSAAADAPPEMFRFYG